MTDTAKDVILDQLINFLILFSEYTDLYFHVFRDFYTSILIKSIYRTNYIPFGGTKCKKIPSGGTRLHSNLYIFSYIKNKMKK